MKLLIVDDSEQMRRLIKCMVSEPADTVYECEDGADALSAYSAHQPDWVLMDIEMKMLDGIAATRQIMASFPDAKIVIVTQYNDQEMRAAGAVEYVLKDNLWAVNRILRPRGHRL